MKRIVLSLMLIFAPVVCAELKVGDVAPDFKIKNHKNQDFELASRKGKWTVLFFYPKAGTPGCTKQACAFRDNIKFIRQQNAEVFGISADSVEAQAKFHEEHQMSFDLLADANAEVIKLYGTKMPVVSLSKRWTFIVDPNLKIVSIDKDVDPLIDAVKVGKTIEQLQSKP